MHFKATRLRPSEIRFCFFRNFAGSFNCGSYQNIILVTFLPGTKKWCDASPILFYRVYSIPLWELNQYSLLPFLQAIFILTKSVL